MQLKSAVPFSFTLFLCYACRKWVRCRRCSRPPFYHLYAHHFQPSYANSPSKSQYCIVCENAQHFHPFHLLDNILDGNTWNSLNFISFHFRYLKMLGIHVFQHIHTHTFIFNTSAYVSRSHTISDIASDSSSMNISLMHKYNVCIILFHSTRNDLER